MNWLYTFHEYDDDVSWNVVESFIQEKKGNLEWK